MATATATPLREKLGVKSPAEAITWLNVLVYGDPGVGKTFLCGTADDEDTTRPVLWIDVEGGTTTIRHKKDIDVITVRNYDELKKVYNEIRQANDNYYKTVVIDTISELQKLDMKGIMHELAQRRPDLDPDVPGMREWGKSAEHMRTIIRAFRDLPMNTLYTAHAEESRDENNVLSIKPAMPGKLKVEIPGFMDIVAYYYTVIEDDLTTRRLQLAKTRRIVAKDRTDTLGQVIENPTIPMMWEMMRK
jgi:phage nucleotide-binding protein